MKRKVQISRLILAFASIILVVALTSCGESGYPENPSKWIVKKTEPHKSKKEMNIYLVSPIESLNLNMSSTWFVDSAGKFKAGDTLYFQPCHQ